jgi:carboxypeptidase C (cathepsin A)
MTFAFANDSGFEETLKLFLEQFFHEPNDKEQSSFTSTHHTIDLPNGQISYKAITGLLPQYLDSGKQVGQLFFTAYLKEDAKPDRPLSFIFDGGPGGSSMAMHIGGFAPRRLLLPEEGQKPLPPYQMIDNPETILDVSDLIFIDPVGTGYSQAERNEYKSGYYSVEGDLYSFGEFIRMFCIHFSRWNSPKYLIGASYGTIRAIGLAESLANMGIYLNGIALMSTAFDYHFLVQQRDLPFSNWLNIPSFAATAWYHKRAMQEKPLEEVIDYARHFIYEQYAPVMLQPSRLGPVEQLAFYQNFASLIGLPLETIRRFEGRINERTFTTEFFATDRKVLGEVDSRYIGDVSSLASEYNEDPSYRDLRPAFYPAFLNYLQTELETKEEFKYISFSPEAFFFWNWSTHDSDNLPSFLQRLRRTLVDNPHMKVFIGSGYYDLRTPFAAMEYSIDHLELPASYRNNFQIEYYPAGHGFIFHLPSLKKFKQDLIKFYDH